jgi:hypothetical protein
LERWINNHSLHKTKFTFEFIEFRIVKIVEELKPGIQFTPGLNKLKLNFHITLLQD